MKEYFEKAFAPVLERIQDQDLKEKTVLCWVRAAEEAGWTEKDLDEIPFTLLTETEGITLIEHTLAVTMGAAGLAEAMQKYYKKMPLDINMDYLYAGGLLHDVGKLLEYEKVDGNFRKSFYGKCARHPISGAIVAAQVGLPKEIINMIANHAKEGEGRPQRIETVLIHQADYATFNPMVMRVKGLLIE
jgi:putative nucleotidyltransferase with HDIG domain